VNHNYNIATNIPGVLNTIQRRSVSSIDPKTRDLSSYDDFHNFPSKTPIKQEHSLLQRRSLDKSSENDASLETLKEANISARKAGGPSPYKKQQTPLMIEEDEYRTDVMEYT
jgi:hypothetical protein